MTLELKTEPYRLYFVISDDGRWQALVPGLELAKAAGRFFTETDGRGYDIRDAGEVTAERIKALSPDKRGYRFLLAEDEESLAGDRSKVRAGIWLGNFASDRVAQRYGNLVQYYLDEPIHITLERAAESEEPEEL